MLTKKQKDTPKWFYFILILIPITLILFTEVFLRLINYGNDYEEWVRIDTKYEILAVFQIYHIQQNRFY
jgi:hypothetical protein